MDKNHPLGDRADRISRPELEAIIRRAAELYASETDTDDGITEPELIRIAAELGLPPRLVRQALYERPAREAEPTLTDRLFGPAQLTVGRAIPADSDQTLRELEEYLTTREYLQVVRRQPGRIWFLPADDFISKVIRSVTRPSSRYLLGRARGIALEVHPLEEDRSYIRLDLNLAALRREALIVGGVVGGGPVGFLAGGVAAAIIDNIAGPIGVTGIFAALGGGMIASASAGLAIAAAAFRRQRKTATGEVDSLLDRIESGERLEPPLPPWRRRLQSRLLRLPTRP